MFRSALQAVSCIVYFFLFSACTLTPEKTDFKFFVDGRQHLQGLSHWQFNGRIALQNHENSWSANIEWVHTQEQDRLLFSGPFGQGAVRIYLQSESIKIDYGDGRIESSKSVDEYIARQLGFFVPALALRYWVVGLVVPDTIHSDFDNGFSQLGWEVHYSHFTLINAEMMPQKIKILQGDAKLKLIIDHWIIYG